jgi:ATP-dependent Clp protease, protease subunit
MEDGDKELEDNGIFLLSGEIDYDTCDPAMRFIIKANFEAKFDHLTLIINSEGGFINAGYSLIDIMEGSRIPIHTVGLGQIVSMGLQIFIAGAKGHRLLTPNTIIMSHQWSGASFGKEHELVAQQKHNEIVTQQVIRHYRKHTGLSESDIKKYLLPPTDVFLTATEAKKYKICDVVKGFNELLPKKEGKKTLRKLRSKK